MKFASDMVAECTSPSVKVPLLPAPNATQIALLELPLPDENSSAVVLRTKSSKQAALPELGGPNLAVQVISGERHAALIPELPGPSAAHLIRRTTRGGCKEKLNMYMEHSLRVVQGCV